MPYATGGGWLIAQGFEGLGLTEATLAGLRQWASIGCAEPVRVQGAGGSPIVSRPDERRACAWPAPCRRRSADDGHLFGVVEPFVLLLAVDLHVVADADDRALAATEQVDADVAGAVRDDDAIVLNECWRSACRKRIVWRATTG